MQVFRKNETDLHMWYVKTPKMYPQEKKNTDVEQY